MAPTLDGKPGSACLCCRRRKLKCTREPSGCENCLKTDLPCIYPTPEVIKRKRGPYKKKDKPAREAHLEHVVKYLSDPVSQQRSHTESPPSPSTFAKETSTLSILAQNEPERPSEDLVKDALIALTRAAVSDEPKPIDYASPGMFRQPSARHVLDMWNLYTIRVDPMAKIIHCPTFASQLFAVLDGNGTPSTKALAVTVYFAAITACSVEECRVMFNEERAVLLAEYNQVIEEDVIRNHNIPDLEFMQAMVLYLLCRTRDDSGSTTGSYSLFSLTVRNAQLMGLHVEPSMYMPYEAEMRRRLWWVICSLESRCSEEGYSRTKSLWSSLAVKLPANLEDNDLNPASVEIPQPRTGITSMSFVLIRFEIQRSSVRNWSISKERPADADLKKRLQADFDVLGKHLEQTYLRHCHPTRPFDWLIITIADVMMIKCCLVIQHGGNRLEALNPQQRHEVLRLSVMIIRTGYRLLSNPKSPEHFWYFRSYLQWHSLAIIIAEISHSTNQHFVQTSWRVIEPFINIWDRAFRNKAGDQTWNYVNELIQKAKQRQSKNTGLSGPVSGAQTSCSSGMFPYPAPEQYEPRLSYHSPDSLTSDEYQLQGMDIPLDIDFDALNAVFGSTNWSDAMNMGMS